jgi:hypothetical protein
MSEQRARVIVGEGRPARKGVLRFVLENEGYDVVAEVGSTMELAQQLVVHRPDVVVLDEGIDVSAVSMLHEVLPDAKVILVWPAGVAAMGADARLEPSEVMHGLGPTVARSLGRPSPILTAPPSGSEVIVVPEPEPSSERPSAAPTAAPARAPEPSPLVAPTWSYRAPTAPRGPRRTPFVVVISVLATLAVVGLVAAAIALRRSATVPIRSAARTAVSPTPSPSVAEGVSTEPGEYQGVVDVSAVGSIRLRSSGDVRLTLEGTSHLTAHGEVRVRGEGIVKNVNGQRVRVHGSGTIRLVVDGSVRLRVNGSLSGRSRGTLRISGDGTFLIHHRPL